MKETERRIGVEVKILIILHNQPINYEMKIKSKWINYRKRNSEVKIKLSVKLFFYY